VQLVRRVIGLGLLILAKVATLNGQYKPEVTLSDSLGRIADSMERLPDSLGGISNSLASADSNLAALTDQVLALARSIGEVQRSLGDVRAVVDQYQDSIMRYQAMIERAYAAGFATKRRWSSPVFYIPAIRSMPFCGLSSYQPPAFS
jgi:methyl-accepting chemotaxis protein